MKQCVFLDRSTGARCAAFGDPDESGNFSCDRCLMELERCLNEVATKAENRHTNN